MTKRGKSLVVTTMVSLGIWTMAIASVYSAISSRNNVDNVKTASTR